MNHQTEFPKKKREDKRKENKYPDLSEHKNTKNKKNIINRMNRNGAPTHHPPLHVNMDTPSRNDEVLSFFPLYLCFGRRQSFGFFSPSQKYPHTHTTSCPSSVELATRSCVGLLLLLLFACYSFPHIALRRRIFLCPNAAIFAQE
ncbi:Hypothetical protein, putative [Bodo saltans]|uniref:Uncharacterized protein n=1 Tax=Bodo saltans TaxID=75058 RepID=A0A0S4ILD0_BODSA|nr:Hypothetical protein, putative [Bodo saltans]|eukprot:CUE71026.1 Hypothetical protein, putative [Bodo saltans]